MNQNAYFNVIATLLLAAVVSFGILGINAVDRVRFNLEEIKHSLRELGQHSGTGTMRLGTSAAEESKSTGGGMSGSPVSRAANAEFFDPNAQQGGRLISAIESDTKNMNALVNGDATVAMLWSKTMDTLAERNYENINEFQPLLAESWTLSEDKMTYRIKLRKGILWHDFTDPVTGREWRNVEVTAQDFQFYVNVIQDETVDAAPMRGYLQGIKEVRVLNDYEFEVVWKEKYFLSMEITLSLSPLPRHLYHAYEGPFDGRRFNDDHERNRIIVGCGPYRFVRWDKGRRILLKRFEKYYGAALGIMPPVETLVFELIQHPNTRLQALISEDIDEDSLTPDQWVHRTSGKASDETDGILRKIKYPSFSYNYIGMNQKNPLFRDRRVRIALSHLVDRERIIRDVYFNLARPVSGPFPLDNPANNPDILPYEFSVETAKRLLAEAGWKDSDGDGILDKDGIPFTFRLMYPNTSTIYQKMLPLIKEDMAKAGVNMELLGLEWAVVVQRLEKKNYEACALGWTGTLTPDPYQLWHSSYADMEGSSNHIGFVNAEADSLIEQIRVCFDPAERERLYHAFHRLIHEEEPYIFLFSPYNLMVINRRYENVHIFPTGVPTNILWVPKDQQLAVPGA